MTPNEKVKEIMRLYDRAYTDGCKVLARYQPCDFVDGTCFYHREEHRKWKDARLRVNCCGGCKFHSKRTGCRVKALSCKLWYCGSWHGPKKRAERKLQRILTAFRRDVDKIVNDGLNRSDGYMYWKYPICRQSRAEYEREMKGFINHITREEM